MATGMLGANTDELRALAGIYGKKAEAVSNAERVTVPEVEGVKWEGPDAEKFKREYGSVVAPSIRDLASRLRTAQAELTKQAGDQDTCSQAKGAPQSGPTGPVGPGGQEMSVYDALKTIYKSWNFLRKPGQALRFAMEAFALAKNPWMAAPWVLDNARDWATITGLIRGTGGLKLPAEFTIEGKAADYFGKLYNGTKWYTDMLGGNPISAKLEGLLKPSWRQGLEDFVGKSGRGLARGMGAFGVMFDSVEGIQAAAKGDWLTGANGDITKGAAWNGAQAVLGGLCFVPGPVGWVATGVSAGMAVYENWDTISNAAQSFVKDPIGSVTSFGSTVADTGSKVLSALNPFD